MKIAFQLTALLIVVEVAFVGSTQAVTLPKCTAPPYGGEAAIKAIGDELAWPYHLTMMINESDNGRVAYCLTRSGMVESGLSFGVSQLDLRTNTKAWSVLVGILQQAARQYPNLSFDNNELSYLRSRLVGISAPRARDLLKQNDPKLDLLLVRVSDALKSDSSRAVIDAIHTEDVKSKVVFISRVQNDMRSSSVGAGKLLETSLVAKLLVRDFRNLFGSITGKLEPFMKTGVVKMTSGTVSKKAQNLTVSDIMQFVLMTKQGAGCRPNQKAELLRRMGNVIDIARAHGDKTAWTPEDRHFFKQTLPTILASPCVSHQVDLGHVRRLTTITL